MEDARTFNLEESLWTGGPERYRELVDAACLMVLPAAPSVYESEGAIRAVRDTPRWSRVAFYEQTISRPAEGVVVLAYKARAERDGHAGYDAFCTTVYRRLDHGVWRVVQHQQTPPMAAAGAAA